MEYSYTNARQARFPITTRSPEAFSGVEHPGDQVAGDVFGWLAGLVLATVVAESISQD
jgi:hypothetical protein